MKIFLVGPMGSGKSKIGKLLSSEINLNLIDIDKEIEAKFEKTIVEIFASEGEEGFRDKEINFLEKIKIKNMLYFAVLVDKELYQLKQCRIWVLKMLRI